MLRGPHHQAQVAAAQRVVENRLGGVDVDWLVVGQHLPHAVGAHRVAVASRRSRSAS